MATPIIIHRPYVGINEYPDYGLYSGFLHTVANEPINRGLYTYRSHGTRYFIGPPPGLEGLPPLQEGQEPYLDFGNCPEKIETGHLYLTGSEIHTLGTPGPYLVGARFLLYPFIADHSVDRGWMLFRNAPPENFRRHKGGLGKRNEDESFFYGGSRLIKNMANKLWIGGQANSRGGEEVEASAICRLKNGKYEPIGDGLNGRVNCLAIKGNKLYAGGEFTHSGDQPCNAVAKLNNDQWEPVADNLYGDVTCLAVFRDELYAAGEFHIGDKVNSDVVFPNRILTFDETEEWMTHNNGLSSYVTAFVIVDNILYAAEYTPTDRTRLMKYNESEDRWEEVITLIGQIKKIIPYKQKKMILCGKFASIAGKLMNSVATYDTDEEAWESLGSGLLHQDKPAIVNSIAVFKGRIYAGGVIDTALVAPNYLVDPSVKTSVNNIASFPEDAANGQWNDLKGGIEWEHPFYESSAVVTDLAVHHGKLIVCGRFTKVGGELQQPYYYSFAAWSGSWSEMPGTDYPFYKPHAMLIFNGELWAIGDFAVRISDTQVFQYVVKFDGQQWTPGYKYLPYSFWGRRMRGLFVHDHRLYIYGNFSSDFYAYGQNPVRGSINSILKVTDDLDFIPVGGGFPANGDNIYNQYSSKNGTGVYAAIGFKDCLFASINIQERRPVGRLAKLDEENEKWVEVGGGVNGSIHALAVYNDKLYLGGQFSYAGDRYCNNLAAWDGVRFHNLGGGLNDHTQFIGGVRAMVEFQEKLFITGTFTSGRLFSWDGQKFYLEGGVYEEPTAMNVCNGQLIIAQANWIFSGPGAPYDYWRSGYSIYGSGSYFWLYGGEYSTNGYAPAYALAGYQGQLYVGGAIKLGQIRYLFRDENPGELSIKSEVSRGLDGKVRAMLEFDGDLIIAGEFKTAFNDSPVDDLTANILVLEHHNENFKLGPQLNPLGGSDQRPLPLSIHELGSSIYCLPQDVILQKLSGSNWQSLFGSEGSNPNGAIYLSPHAYFGNPLIGNYNFPFASTPMYYNGVWTFIYGYEPSGDPSYFVELGAGPFMNVTGNTWLAGLIQFWGPGQLYQGYNQVAIVPHRKHFFVWALEGWTTFLGGGMNSFVKANDGYVYYGGGVDRVYFQEEGEGPFGIDELYARSMVIDRVMRTKDGWNWEPLPELLSARSIHQRLASYIVSMLAHDDDVYVLLNTGHISKWNTKAQTWKHFAAGFALYDAENGFTVSSLDYDRQLMAIFDDYLWVIGSFGECGQDSRTRGIAKISLVNLKTFS